MAKVYYAQGGVERLPIRSLQRIVTSDWVTCPNDRGRHACYDPHADGAENRIAAMQMDGDLNLRGDVVFMERAELTDWLLERAVSTSALLDPMAEQIASLARRMQSFSSLTYLLADPVLEMMTQHQVEEGALGRDLTPPIPFDDPIYVSFAGMPEARHWYTDPGTPQWSSRHTKRNKGSTKSEIVLGAVVMPDEIAALSYSPVPVPTSEANVACQYATVWTKRSGWQTSDYLRWLLMLALYSVSGRQREPIDWSTIDTSRWESWQPNDRTRPANDVQAQLKKKHRPFVLNGLMSRTECGSMVQRLVMQCREVEQLAAVSQSEHRNATVTTWLKTFEGLKATMPESDVLRRFQAARLYEFDPQVLVRVQRSLLQHLWVQAGHEYPGMSREEMKDRVMQLIEGPEAISMYEPWQFGRSLFIAFGKGTGIGEAGMRKLKRLGLDASEGRCLAYLVQPDHVYLITFSNGWNFHPVYRDGKWSPEQDVMLFSSQTLGWLLRLIDGGDATIVQRRRKQSRSERRKKERKLPPLFYTVTASNSVVDANAPKPPPAEPRQRAEHTFRWQVEGHERLYVKRDQLPLATELKDKLLARGYQVFEGLVDERCTAALARRKHRPQQPGEWLAVRYTQVDSYLSPARDDLPFIPSVKRVRSGSN